MNVILSEERKFDCFYNIVFDSGNYYGVNDLNNKDNWDIINENDIVKVSKTKSQYFKNIVYQEDNYFGVPDSEEYDNLIRIDENQVVKISKHDPGVSILASILAVPIFVAVLWLSLVIDDDDDW